MLSDVVFIFPYRLQNWTATWEVPFVIWVTTTETLLETKVELVVAIKRLLNWMRWMKNLERQLST